MTTPAGEVIDLDAPPAETPPVAEAPAPASEESAAPEAPAAPEASLPAGDIDIGLPAGLTLVTSRLVEYRNSPPRNYPAAPTWMDSPAPNKLLRAYMLRFWGQTTAPQEEKEARLQIRRLVEELTLCIEQTLGQDEETILTPDFLPQIFTPLYNDVHTLSVRIVRERLAYRALWYLHKWGFNRVPPPKMLLRVRPDNDPVREVSRREQRKLRNIRLKQESWMPPKGKKLLDESAVEDEIRDDDDDGELEDEVPEVEARPRAEKEKPLYPGGPTRSQAGRPPKPAPSEPAQNPFPEMPAASAAPSNRRGADPVQAWLPSGYKLRLWRKGEPGELDVHLRDFPTEALRRFTGILEALEQVVRPSYGPFPGQGDVGYVVCFVNPKGVEGPRHEYRLGAPPMASLGGPPAGAPVAPPVQPPQSFSYQPNGSPPSGLLQTVEEVMAVEDRFNRRQQSQQPVAGPAPQGAYSPEVEELRRRSEMLEIELMQLRSERQSGQQPVSHDVGIAQVLSQTLQRVLPPAGMGQAGAMTQQGPSFIELMSMMESQRASTIALMQSLMPKPGIDPGLMEIIKRMDERQARLEEAREEGGPSDIEKFVHQAQVFRSLMGVDVNGPLFKQKETEGFLGVLKEFIDKGPEFLREYQNTMRTTAQLQYGVNIPQPNQQQAQHQQAQLMASQQAQAAQRVELQRQQDAQLAAARRGQRRNSLPPDIRKAIEALVKAATPEQMVEGYGQLQEAFAKHAEMEQKQREKIQAAGQPVPESVFGPVIAGIEKLFTRAMTTAVEGADAEAEAHAAAERQAGREQLAQYLVQLLDFIGYGVEATPEKVQAITKALFDRLDEEAFGEEDDEQDGDDEELEEEAEVTAEAPAAEQPAPASPQQEIAFA